MKNKLAIVFLAFFAIISIASMWNDSAIVDEGPHLPAGYSYLTQKDMRLNPEHPPLLKDLAALPLLFMEINFPSQIKSWTDDINGQWDFGHYFFYQSDNDAQNMLRAGRIPIILIGLLLGFFIFKTAGELWGKNIGLLALFLYVFSPTILAHTRFVTTDVGAAAGFFIGFYYFYKWLKSPTLKNSLIFGVVFGLALLAKFSTILLPLIFAFLVLVWVLLNKNTWSKSIKIYLGGFILSSVVALFVVGLIYVWHVWNYPPSRQIGDTVFTLGSFGFRPAIDFVTWLVKSNFIFFRALGQYFLGVLMVLQRQAGGNTTYFLGEVSGTGSRIYFPLVYLIKEPLAYILMMLFVVYLAFKKFYIWRINEYIKEYGKDAVVILDFQDFKRLFPIIIGVIKTNFAEFAMIFTIVLYWTTSMRSNLNIGVRHLIPTLPFIYLLTARQVGFWIKATTERISNYQGFWQVFGLYWRRSKRIFVLSVLLLWASLSVIFTFPSFLAYFNEIAGGPDGGYKIVADSNLDWGQDLLRLTRFVKQNNIQSIGVDYFGGGDVKYYLGDTARTFDREIPQKGWLAVSATFLQVACQPQYVGSCHYDQRSYVWLDQYKPIAKIGYSIFIYKIE